MSIKLIARDLYRLQREVDRLEQALETAPLEKRSRIEAQLRDARRQKASLRSALDGRIGRSSSST
jgi:hypothetical protein